MSEEQITEEKTDGDILADGAGQTDADAKPVDKGADGKPEVTEGGDVLSDDDGSTDEGVPDQYTLDLEKLGVDERLLKEGVIDEFKGKAKELGLTQKQFEGLAQYDVERTQAANSEAVDAWHERVSGWRDAAKADKEFGGESYASNVKVAMGAVSKFGDDEFKALLKSPSEDNPEGLAIGNHPAVLRFLNRIGKAMSDPDLVLGEDVQKSDDTEARLRRLYPSMYKD